MLIGKFSETVISWSLGLDGIIYDLVRHAYDIFLGLANTSIFKENDYNNIVHKIYIILGVFMLFFLSYSLLCGLFNPDKANEGDSAFPNIIKNVLISLAMITLLPFVFRLAYNVQKVILRSGVIGKIILSDNINTTNGVTADSVIDNGGNIIASQTFFAFFHPDPEYCSQYYIDNGGKDYYKDELIQMKINGQKEKKSFQEITEFVQGNSQAYPQSFKLYVGFAGEADEGHIDYKYFISTIVGILLFIIILAFCVDMGIRVVKLAFLQIIAPIPIICRAIPKQKGIFDNWLKSVIKTFVDVFVKIFVMYIGVYTIYLITLRIGELNNNFYLRGAKLAIAEVFLIVGVLLFVKQAPNLLKDIFGFDGAGLFANAKDALKIGRAATGAVGVGAHALTHNLVGGMKKSINHGRAIHAQKKRLKKFYNLGLITGNEYKSKKKAASKQYSSVFAEGFRSIGSGLAGGISGAGRGLVGGYKSNNLKDWKNNKQPAYLKTQENKDKRARYRAQHGGTFGAIGGHVIDAGSKLGEWAGVGNTLKELQDQNEAIKNAQASKKAMDDSIFSELEKLAKNQDTVLDGFLKATANTTAADFLTQKITYESKKANGSLTAGDETVYRQYLKRVSNAVSSELLNKQRQFRNRFIQDGLAVAGESYKGALMDLIGKGVALNPAMGNKELKPSDLDNPAFYGSQEYKNILGYMARQKSINEVKEVEKRNEQKASGDDKKGGS